jgi:hypothetical protein
VGPRGGNAGTDAGGAGADNSSTQDVVDQRSRALIWRLAGIPPRRHDACYAATSGLSRRDEHVLLHTAAADGDREKEIEILVLRHQLTILQR